jgi:hypothetical protein
MTRRQQTSIAEIALSRIIGIVVFLVFVGVLNLVANPSSGPVLMQATAFVNTNLGQILFFSVLFLAGDLSRVLGFPLNLAGPIFNAAASVLLVGFIAKIFVLVDTINGMMLFAVIERLLPILSLLVFFVVLISGYYEILTSPGKHDA